ncbi:DHA2 family efflux MFS transporter permease subunit [Alkalihalobacterium alkalinitrilicum]|uniref:DHA2 family efflux MFS transporter permease subunit n=1 Tax=Alkalihalobacterium alkalinitrilicum TaxID=427920 RepID=UPI001EE481D2|nr:DHA2 family efflux MFS transporter permease subunit [Alkalihalobacterium alkalinitrilicum]
MSNISEKWMVVIAVLIGTFTLILNNSMLNPAVPQLMTVFDTDAVSTGWVITIFMVTMGMTMPLTGFLGDKWGKKRLYIIGLGIFVVGSILGTFSWNLSSLIIFRGIQGVGGGIMMPLSMALIFANFPKQERGMATGIYGVAAMMAPTIGPTIGGIIIETGSWHYLFLCNVPFGLLGIWFASKYLKETEMNSKITFDRWGFITVTIGVGLILLALGRTSSLEHLTNALNISFIVIGSVCLVLFIMIEKKQKYPLLDLTIFKITPYSLSVCVSGVMSIGLFGGVFLIPLLLQNVYGFNAIVTGLVFLPTALLMGIFMTVGGRILDQRGGTGVITTGLIISTICTFLLGSLTMETSLAFIIILMAIRGVGFGLSSMPATTAGMNAIPEQFISRGSAMNNVLRQMSSALGIVFISIYYEVRKAQLYGIEESVEAANLQAINEGFIILAVLTAITVPLGYLLGKTAKEMPTQEKNVS